uniref:Reverse transcriptase/retrotransposon-derived protein RNase H-like domain-containing protein n=1 Tax=Strix occidentalis caurina TaxID=311401 RepID=A0A8D0FD25_STROC
MTGWCHPWIYNYGLMVKPLYELLKSNLKTLTGNGEADRALRQLKKKLMDAPALGLPDIMKPFWLFSHEKQGIALGVLAQNLGPDRRAVAYFSKQLDEVSKGWPSCLRAVEARKFTLAQKITVLVSHTVSAVLNMKGGHWLSPQRYLKYQALLVEQDDIEIEVTNIVNPASCRCRDGQSDTHTLTHMGE